MCFCSANLWNIAAHNTAVNLTVGSSLCLRPFCLSNMLRGLLLVTWLTLSSQPIECRPGKIPRNRIVAIFPINSSWTVFDIYNKKQLVGLTVLGTGTYHLFLCWCVILCQMTAGFWFVPPYVNNPAHRLVKYNIITEHRMLTVKDLVLSILAQGAFPVLQNSNSSGISISNRNTNHELQKIQSKFGFVGRSCRDILQKYGVQEGEPLITVLSIKNTLPASFSVHLHMVWGI